MKKRVKVVNLIVVILIIIIAIIIVVAILKPSGDSSFWGFLRGELPTLGPGDIVQEGLLAYYPFDGSARDALGAHNGQVNGAKLVSGVYGKAYEFSSSADYFLTSSGSPSYIFKREDYINIPFRRGDSLDVGGREELTTSFWLNLHDIPPYNDGGSRPLYWEYDSTNYRADAIEWFATDSGRGYYKIRFRVISTPGGVSEATCYKRVGYDEWHLFTGTYNGKLVEIFMDGEVCGAEESQGVIRSTNTGNDWVLGDATPDKKLGMNGRMDDLRIYGRTLSDSEIAFLFLGGLEVRVVRSFEHQYDNYYYVNLGIATSTLLDDEIMILTEEVPAGISIVPNSWNIKPSYVFDDKLVWLFANNPPMYYGDLNVSEAIPPSLTYTVSGTGGDFKGKWGFALVDIDGFVAGENRT